MAGSKIFVVDDEAQMRHAISEALTRSGYAVESFSRAADVDRLECSLVITDVRMPGVSGLDLLRRVKSVNASIPVVVMTGFGTIQDAVEAMKLGAFDYLLKPFSLEDIEVTVRKALAASVCPSADPSARVSQGAVRQPKEFLTADPGMQKILEFVQEVARSRSTVLIQGDSGTGKELIARMIHANSRNAEAPFVAVNCAAIPEGLLESELFGHEKGAFSGALARKMGKFERADRGSLLLDEIGEMDLTLQAKLLRVLQEEEIERIGGTGPIPVSVRIIATTNRDLKQEVRAGRFREDLFYRLNVVPIFIPPLRERTSDIRLLSECFLKRHASQMRKPVRSISKEAMSHLERQSYPGNARELENLIERAVLLSQGPTLEAEHLQAPEEGLEARTHPVPGKKKHSVRDMEQELILETLRKVHGNRTRASGLLGISIRTLRNKLAEYRKAGMAVPPYEPGLSAKKKGGMLHCGEK